MANEQNLKPGEYKFTLEEAKKGGRNSAIARREKKTIQKILNDFLETSASDNAQALKIAKKMGINSDNSIKDLFTIACTINTLKSGKLDDLEVLTKLLGEQVEITNGKNQEDDALSKSLKEFAEQLESD